MTPQQKAKLDAVIAAISARAKLDADIDALSADYAARRGLESYDHGVLLEEMYPLEVKEKTDPKDRYPLPDSYQPPLRGTPRLTRPKPLFDREVYEATVADLRGRGYMSVNEASIEIRRSVFLLRQDAAAGYLKAIDAIGFTQRGLSKPRYFVDKAELQRYVQWCDAGRPTADKHRPTNKRPTIAQEGA